MTDDTQTSEIAESAVPSEAAEEAAGPGDDGRGTPDAEATSGTDAPAEDGARVTRLT
jgi:hypothetical protein